MVELCKTRLPDHMGIPADQIQVLTPTRKGPSGTENLNRCLQAALNPPAADKREIQWGERLFRTGDRIMQTKNNYNVVWEKADGTVGTGMFNGDVGRIVEIDPSGELLVVNFDDRIATYTLDMLNEIDLAYAMTVHKAQGSEYQCVVLAAMPAAPSLMVRGGAVHGPDPCKRASDRGGGRRGHPGHGGQRPSAAAVFRPPVEAGTFCGSGGEIKAARFAAGGGWGASHWTRDGQLCCWLGRCTPVSLLSFQRETGAVSLLDQPLREQTPRGRHPASPAYPPSRHG